MNRGRIKNIVFSGAVEEPPPMQHVVRITTVPPTLADKAEHLAGAVVRVGKALLRGEPVRVPDEERDRRLAICRSCPGGHWKKGGNLGLGECSHPQCGCTRFKHGWATEKCPLNLW